MGYKGARKEEGTSPQPPYLRVFLASMCLQPLLEGQIPLRTCSSARIHIHEAKRCSSRGTAAEAGPCSGAIPGSSNDSLRYLGQITLKCV